MPPYPSIGTRAAGATRQQGAQMAVEKLFELGGGGKTVRRSQRLSSSAPRNQRAKKSSEVESASRSLSASRSSSIAVADVVLR